MRFFFGVTGAIVFTLGLARPAQAQVGPLEAWLTNCEPQWDLPPNAFTQGYSGPGWHNPPGSREFRVQMAYKTAAAGDAVADAKAQVERIYLCLVRPDSSGTFQVDCPTGAPYVIWDKTAGIDTINDAWVEDSRTDGDSWVRPGRWEAAVRLSLDWQDPNEQETVIVLRVQLAGAPVPGNDVASVIADAKQFGACSNWQLRASSPRFIVYGPTAPLIVNDQGPPPQQIDLCTFGTDPVTGVSFPGSVVGWGHAPTPSGICVGADQADLVVQWMEAMEAAQQDRLQAALLPPNRQLAWANGEDGAGGFRPHYIFLGPHRGGFGQSTGGGFQVNPHDFPAIVPLDAMNNTNDPRKAFPGAARNTVSLTGHEYFHSLQQVWGREEPTAAPLIHIAYITESHAAAAEANVCMENFPGARTVEDQQCMNAGKLGQGFGGRIRHSNQEEPREDLLTTPYHSALFWGYVYEQFGYPITPANAAHPSGTPSSIERPGSPDVVPALQTRDSDEGMDFVGLLFQEFAVTPAGVNVFDATDSALQVHLGRSFEDVLTDFHTALFLKDYTDTDPRWRFEWANKDGFASTDQLGLAKPFAVPSDLYGATCDGAGTICDGMLRTRRTLDSWTPGVAGGPATRDLLGPGGQRSTSGRVILGPYGTTAASISVDPALAGSDVQVLITHPPRGPLTFRLFRIQEDPATGALIPQARNPLRRVTEADPPLESLSGPVLVDADTRELLVIASNTSARGSHFEIVFGAPAVEIEIAQPNAALPALAGHPSVGRRSFVIGLELRADGRPLAVTEEDKDDLEIEVIGCAETAGCVLPKAAYTIIPVTGGSVLVVATLPDSFYPPNDGALGLTVNYRGSASDTEADAILYNAAGHDYATALVLDRSGSMSEEGGLKLAALKVVAKGLVNSLVSPDAGAPLHQAAMVTFNQEARLPFPFQELTPTVRQDFEAAIDALFASGGTSIGDGIYEAQSALAQTFDGLTTGPDRHALVVVSDGQNTSDAPPETYYHPDCVGVPTGDGHGQWFGGSPLCYAARVNAGLRVPAISAVGIGQDADLAALDQLTRLSGQQPLYVAAPEELGLMSMRKLVNEMSDGLDEAFGRANDFERIVAGEITGSTPEGPVVESGPPDPASSEMPFVVEPGVRDLRVVVTSADVGGSAGALLSPAGTSVSAVATTGDGRSRTFRVVDPQAGEWRFFSTATEASEPNVFVEATVRGALQLFSFSDAETLTANGDVIAGSRVFLRALAVEGQAVTACSDMQAIVLRPGATSPVAHALYDDGAHGDGMANDGVFGAEFPETATPGLHSIVFRATCASPLTGADAHRERRGGFVVALRPEDDPDGDGMPSSWEAECLDPADGSDATADADGDGLSNLLELQIGTSPCRADTDNGGESDGSEHGSRDPLDPSDDLASVPVPELTPGNMQIYMVPGMRFEAVGPEIQWAFHKQGPWQPLIGAWHGTYALHTGLTNGVEVCYRMRWADAARSDWSEPRCATPGEDPTPPAIEVVLPVEACGASFVQPTLRFTDGRHFQPQVPLGTAESGVAEMRIWYGPGPAPASAVWEPAQAKPLIEVPSDATVISVQVRDSAGNLSRVQTLPISCPRPACPYEPETIACCGDAASCAGVRDFALYAEGVLQIGDATKIEKPTGGYADVVNGGSGELNVGVETRTGSLWSIGTVVVRDRAHVEGSITTASGITLFNDVVVSGSMTSQSADLQLPALSTFSVPFPATPGSQVQVQNDQVHTLAPGSFGAVDVKSRGELRVSSGTYVMTSLNLEPDARLKVDSTEGPVYLYVKTALTHKGLIQDTRGLHNHLIIGYFGTATAFVETALSATLVAPSARVELKALNSGGVHRGAVYAKEIAVHSQTKVEHHPFVGPWEGGIVAGDSWGSGEDLVQARGCGCSVPGARRYDAALACASLLLAGFVMRRRRRAA